MDRGEEQVRETLHSSLWDSLFSQISLLTSCFVFPDLPEATNVLESRREGLLLHS